MAATLNFVAATGTVTFTGADGVNDVFTLSKTGTTWTFANTGETITVTGDTTGFIGSGTNTVTYNESGNTTVLAMSLALGTGTNTYKIFQTTAPLTITCTGTDAVTLSSTGNTSTGVLTGITADISVTVNSGTTTLTAGQCIAGANVVVGSSSTTGLIGATGDKTLSYTVSGGSIVFAINGNNSSGVGDTFKIRGTPSTGNIFNAQGGDDAFVVGTSAGSAAGCDAVSGTLTLTGGAGSNTLNVDDSGSASGGKTYTLTPATTSAGSSTFAGAGSGTYTFTASAGSYSAWTFKGSTTGGANTFKIATRNPPISLTYNGGGSDVFDFSALSGYTITPATSSTGTVTFSNAATLTYTGMAPIVPTNTVAPSCSPSSGTTATSFAFAPGTWTGSPTSYETSVNVNGGGWSVIDTSAGGTPTKTGAQLGGVGTIQTRVRAYNSGGGWSGYATGTTLTVSAATSGGPPPRYIGLGIGAGL